MAVGNPFDIEALRIDPADPTLAPATPTAPDKRRKWKRHFIQVPWEWVQRLNGASGQTYRLALQLLYLHWKNRGAPIKLTNSLLVLNSIPAQTKRRALRELQRRGLISVEWRLRKSPIVRFVLD
jgi:hypothetical protein